MKSDSVSEFFDLPGNYLHRDFGVQIRTRIIKDLLGDLMGKKILDIGCGDGTLSLQFQKENKITLLDASEQMLKLARKRIHSPQNVNVIHSTLDTHLPGRMYDVIICVGLLAHLDDWKMSIKQIEQMVLPGTRIVIQISDSSRFLTRWVLNPRGKRTHKLNQITFKELIDVCIESKFKLLKAKRFGFSLPGMGYLPNKILFYYTLMTQKSILFSKVNTEVIALFEKV